MSTWKSERKMDGAKKPVISYGKLASRTLGLLVICILLASSFSTLSHTVKADTLPLASDQVLGVQLPTPLAPAGNITGTITQGGAPNFADTYATPFIFNQPGNITGWTAQFAGGNLTMGIGVPLGIQLKILRQVNDTTLLVVQAGPVHDPRPILQGRFGGAYPFFTTESSAIKFNDTRIPVQPGDIIGLTIMSDPSVGGYFYPLVSNQGTHLVLRNVPLAGAIELNDAFTGTLRASPAVQVRLQTQPLQDINGDGIPDIVALSPEMQALGADPCRKTIAVQIDYMNASDHSHRPLQAALDKVIAAFDSAPVPATLPCPYAGFPKKPSGISLIIDVKNAIREQAALNFSLGSPETFETVRANHFSATRVPYFHYSLWVHDLASGSSVSGIGELFGQNFIVSLGKWTNHVGTVDEQAGTFMHELGHNLGLDHGGADSVNNKPNYISVMNYAFQVVGITSQGGTHRFDYSHVRLPSLIESELTEGAGIGDSTDYTSWKCPDGSTRTGLGNGALDWNCNIQIDGGAVGADVNGDGTMEVMNGNNDWANLIYNFRNSVSFKTGAHDLPSGLELTFEQARPIELFWQQFSSVKVSKFFTDSNLNPLPSDRNGNPKVDVVLANGKVSSTNPGQVLAWIRTTDIVGGSIQSFRLNETLPVDWTAHPAWLPAKGAVHVFFQFANGTKVEITDLGTISISDGNPETVGLAVPDLNSTTAKSPLVPGESILLSVQLAYALKGTAQSASSYPRNYTDMVTVATFSKPLFLGTVVSASTFAFFIAYAKVLGDVNGDFKVDIFDVALVAFAYGSRPGDSTWNSAADLTNDGVIDIQDVAMVAFYYGTHA